MKPASLVNAFVDDGATRTSILQSDAGPRTDRGRPIAEVYGFKGVVHKNVPTYLKNITIDGLSRLLAQWSESWLWLGRARVRSPLTAIFLKNFILEKANNVLLVRDWQGSTGMSILLATAG